MTVPRSAQESREPRSEAALRQWVAGLVAARARLREAEVQPDVPFADYGLDSLSAVTLVADLEDGLGLQLDSTAALEYPTVGELAGFLLAELEKERAEGARRA